jgi:hypothetical protein
MISATMTVLAAQTANQTATEFYVKYRAAFDKAKAVEELLPYMSKAMKAKVEETPAGERAKMFEMIKEMSKMSNVKVVKETKNEQGVMLSVEAVGEDRGKMTGQIQVVKEDGVWKMGRESWSSKG